MPIFRGILAACGVIAGAYLLLVEFARYSGVFFCGVLLATALSALARLLNYRQKLPHVLALGLLLLLLLGIGALLAVWTGPQLVAQFNQLGQKIPEGLRTVEQWFKSTALGERLMSKKSGFDSLLPEESTLAASAQSLLVGSVATLTDALIVLVIGVMVAANPHRYKQGLVALLPEARRGRASEILVTIADTLRRWLVARFTTMLLVGVLFGIGLLILGIPLAIPLAVIAMLLSFVPYLGPAVTLIPAVSIGLLQSVTDAIYVVCLYLGIQLVESYLAEPLIEAKAVWLPPALIIVAQVISGAWIGALGVIIATPLLVVVVVLVQVVYQKGILDEEIATVHDH